MSTHDDLEDQARDEAAWAAMEYDRVERRRELKDDVRLVRELVANDDDLALSLVNLVRAFNHEKARRETGPTTST